MKEEVIIKLIRSDNREDILLGCKYLLNYPVDRAIKFFQKHSSTETFQDARLLTEHQVKYKGGISEVLKGPRFNIFKGPRFSILISSYELFLVKNNAL